MVENRLFGARSACVFSLLLSFLLAGVAAATAADTVVSPSPPAAVSTAPLSLKQCVDLALDKNRFRTASRYSIDIAEAQHQQALSGYWPQIGVKASYAIMDQDPNFIFPSQNISMPQGTALVMQVTNPLAPGGSIQMPLSNLPVPEQNVIYNTTERYFQLKYLQMQLN